MNFRYSTYQLFKKTAITFIYLVIINFFTQGVFAAEVTSKKNSIESSREKLNTPVSDTAFIIEPNIKRSHQKQPGFDTSFIQITPFIGTYKLDGFGVEIQEGVKLAFNLHRRFFFEFAYGLTEIDESTRTNLGYLPLIDNKELDYYDLSLGYNVLISKLHCKLCGYRVLNTDVYLLAGFGNVNIDTTPGNDISDKSINIGLGLRTALLKHLYFNTSIKNQIMNENLLDNTSSAQNLSYDLGLGIYF